MNLFLLFEYNLHLDKGIYFISDLKDKQRETTQLVSLQIAELLAAKELVSPQRPQASRLASPQKDGKWEGEESVSLQILMG